MAGAGGKEIGRREMKRSILFCLTVIVMLGPVRSGAEPRFFSRDGAAIGGYDTVAYFLSGQALPGRDDIAVMWKGAVWRFASRKNRETFEANPRAYAPRYGGYCAYGMAQGHVRPTDPTAWRIVEGRLYLTHSHRVKALWEADIEGHLARAEANWPRIRAR